jgi:hypothetical protein
MRDREIHHKNNYGGGNHESKDYFRVYRLQAAQLQHDEGQEGSS